MSIFSSLASNSQLVRQLTTREVIGRYRGSILGIAWSFFNPLIMLTVYTFVFSVIFQAKWSIGSGDKSEFALILFIGMIVHGILSECLINSPSLMLRNTNYVKKVVFPLEILPWVLLGSTLFHAFISLLVWMLFYLLINHALHWTVVFLPVVILPLILFSLGISWALASLGVYLRDINQMTGVLSTVLLFLSPIFYPASILPEAYQSIIYLNPLTFIIEQARDVLMWGNTPNWTKLGLAYLLSILVAQLGFVWFQKTRKGFADVL